MPARAALFDLDGTLIDSLPDIARSMNEALARHGLPEHDEPAYKRFVGDGVVNLSRRACGARADLADAVLQDYSRIYAHGCLRDSRVYDGVPEMLFALTARGIALCVVSNKDDADVKRVLRHYFPSVSFSHVRGRVPGMPIKPDPAGPLEAARQMNVNPEAFIYLGDSGVDMRCARAAGMTAVGALWGFRTRDELEQSGAHHVIQTPLELLELPEV